MTNSRDRLLEATIASVATSGYVGTTVDEICARAGVTKGAFFHHFASKEALTVAAVHRWSERCSALFAAAPFNELKNPLQRFLGYLDFRKKMVRVPLASTGCVFSLIIRETNQSHPEIRDACEEFISRQFARMEKDISEALELYAIDPRWSSKSLAIFAHAVLQGIYVSVQWKNDFAAATESVDHLRHYVEMLFGTENEKRVQKCFSAVVHHSEHTGGRM